jgi:putative transposase
MVRRRLTHEQVQAILQAAQEPGVTVAEVCRRHSIALNQYYRWHKRHGQLAPPEVRRPWELEQENARLKRLLAERDLEVDALRQRLSAR